MRAARMLWMIMLGAAAMILVVGCVAPAPPAPATIATSPPPWPAPRDAVAYIEAAGLVEQPLDLTGDQHRLTLSLIIDRRPVPVATDIGIDRPRAVQAVAHTHDDSGTVWLEGREVDEVTLGQFFTLWGVRLTRACVGAACGKVAVTTTPTIDVADPTALRLSEVTALTITVVSS